MLIFPSISADFGFGCGAMVPLAQRRLHYY